MMIARLSRQGGRRHVSLRSGMSMMRSLIVRGTSVTIANTQQLLMMFGVGN